MGKEIDLVRYRNDGDDFHVLWTARRALRMLDPGSELVAVAVEGASEREQLSGVPVEPGLLVIDTAEYYGSEDLTHATQIIYYQLKYSTTSPDKPWSVTGLRGTLKGFAQRYTALCNKVGQDAVTEKVRFRFVSNRPISIPVQKAFSAAVARTPVAKLNKRTKTARKSLLKATGLKVAEFNQFAAQIDLWGNEESHDAQSRALTIDSGRYAVFLDSDASKRMKDLVREKALSKSANNKTIVLETLLQQFGLGSERELFPAEPKFETLSNPIPRTQESKIVKMILESRWPVVIQANGGIGKSILAQRLSMHLPADSETIMFDGFAGGDYRNPRLYRHRHSHGLVHIANELARRGLCDVLIPQHDATEQQYLEAFRKRIEQATTVVRSRSVDAIVLIIIDAADNLGMAADDANEHSFVPNLLQEESPTGSHIIALARTHRVEKYLKPANTVVAIDLEPFDITESAMHLRQKFASASDNDVQAFHHFTDRNPRVQANALAVADDLPSLIGALGPNIETVEELIAGQLDTALDKVVREQASSPAELKPLCTALAALSPPVPMRVLAKAAVMPEDAIRSFVSDFANGRPIVIRDDAIQFRDEPVETWFHDNFMGTPDQYNQIADLITPLATTDGYVATALPILLHRAGRYGELMQLALEGLEPETDDPVEKREIVLRRVQYALKAALAQNRLDDATKLLLRAGEEVAANDRQSSLLMDHADLVSSLAGPNVVSDFIFRQRAWKMSEKGYIYCAAMLTADRRNNVEAERFLSLATLWLRDWFNERQNRPDDEPLYDHERVEIEIEDIAAYAEVFRSLHGVENMLRFMGSWRNWAVFKATRVIASRLLDRGETQALDELLKACSDHIAVRLAVILEMNAVCIKPSVKHVRSTITLLTAKKTAIDLEDYPENTAILLAITATAEIAAQSGVPAAKVLALLDRYPISNDRVDRWHDMNDHRDTVLRVAALKAVLRGKKPTLNDVTPSSVQKILKEKGGENDQEVRQFKEIYGALVPWYGLRALALINQTKGWNRLLKTVQKECRSTSWGWGDNPDLGKAVNEISRIWLEALIWSGRENNVSAAEVEKWLEDQRVMITIPTWTELARCAAHHRDTCHDGALRFAQRARVLIEDYRADASSIADSFVELARATLPLGQEEASSYFQKALEHLNRLGDELHERMFSILALAEKAAKHDQPVQKEAYRVARMGELFHEYNDHKFPWYSVVEAVARLCPATAFAVTSRWHDRGTTFVSWTLPSITLYLLEAGIVSPSVAAALHAFGGYWQIYKQAALFLDKEPNHELQQDILDTLNRDQEFDPYQEESSAQALLNAAKHHDLAVTRLQALVDFQSKKPDRSHHGFLHDVEGKRDVPSAPDWGELLAEINLHTPEGVDEAFIRRQETEGPSDWKEFLAHMRGTIEPAHRLEHILALARSEELMISMVLDAMEACSKDWGASIAVEKALTNAVKIMTNERAIEIIGRGWGVDESINRCAKLSRLSSQDILSQLLQGLTNQIEYISAGALFNLTRTIAESSLSQELAMNALTFGLDRLEPILKTEDGDGPWQDVLAPPPEISRAIANFLYAMLATPEAEMRWRAAHAVRRLCRYGEAQIVSELINLFPSESVPAFTDPDLPFYAMHARLYLLIALARAAEEAPELLVPHIQDFIKWALEGPPHVLIRHFAARAAIELEHNHPGLIGQKDINCLTSVNVSTFSCEPHNYDQPIGWSHRTAERTSRFSFDYDFDRYWLGALGSTFNLPQITVAERAESWIVDQWGKPDLSAWDQDVRARRGLYGRDSHASHGSYPKTDRYSFYLSYHAMFCTAGELLTEFPPSTGYGGKNGWDEWLSGHLLTRPDGKWLADRRDVDPLETRRWMIEENHKKHYDEWQYSVLAEDFDQALGINGEKTQKIPVWGWWRIKEDPRKETIHVSSALVTQKTSMALLRALQTVDNPHDYKVPEEQDTLEINIPDFQFCGWISDPYSETRLDEFDPFGGKIPWPGPGPGRRVRRLLKLIGDKEGRIWHMDNPVLERRIWGGRREDRYRSAGNHGQRLTADLDFLLGMLRHLSRDLIIEVEIERDNGYKKTNEIDFIYRRYIRIYLLRRNGQLDTLHGCCRLRPQTG